MSIQEFQATTETTLTCNTIDCDGIMRITGRTQESVGLRCSRCEQNIALHRSGESSQTILPRMYPSDVSRWAPEMHHEWVEYELRQRLFYLAARVSAEFITPESAATVRATLTRQVIEYKAAHPMLATVVTPPPACRPWWRFWR